MSVIGAIVVSYTGMIATDDKVGAPIILAHQGMEDGFTRASITHGSRKHTHNDAISGIVVLQQHLIAAHAHIGRNIVTFSITH